MVGKEPEVSKPQVSLWKGRRMTIVVKLGGTNGSGKTSVARALLDKMGQENGYVNPTGKCYEGTLDGNRWAILGSYKNVCGGMDTVSDKEIRLQMINDAIGDGFSDVVFFEGLITGKTYGAIGALSEVDNGAKWVYAFMDTPFDVCVERVMQRREAAARGKMPAGMWDTKPKLAPFNPERTMRPTFKSVQATAKRAQAQGHKVLWLPHALKPEHIAQFLINEVKEFSK